MGSGCPVRAQAVTFGAWRWTTVVRSGCRRSTVGQAPGAVVGAGRGHRARPRSTVGRAPSPRRRGARAVAPPGTRSTAVTAPPSGTRARGAAGRRSRGPRRGRSPRSGRDRSAGIGGGDELFDGGHGYLSWVRRRGGGRGGGSASGSAPGTARAAAPPNRGRTSSPMRWASSRCGRPDRMSESAPMRDEVVEPLGDLLVAADDADRRDGRRGS